MYANSSTDSRADPEGYKGICSAKEYFREARAEVIEQGDQRECVKDMIDTLTSHRFHTIGGMGKERVLPCYGCGEQEKGFARQYEIGKTSARLGQRLPGCQGMAPNAIFWPRSQARHLSVRTPPLSGPLLMPEP